MIAGDGQCTVIVGESGFRRGAFWLLAACSSVVAVLASAGPAWSITPKIKEFTAGLSTGRSPFAIARGSDGNLWFTEQGSSAAIGRINPTTHAIHEFDHSNGLQTGSSPDQITAGPDGNVWFADNGGTHAIGRITPAGAITEFSNGLSSSSYPKGIAAGADGNLWFTDRGGPGAIGQFNPTTHAFHEFDHDNGLNSGDHLYYIARGADGNVWFTDEGTTKAIGRITPAGVIKEFSDGLDQAGAPYGIAAGPDGNVWWTDSECPPSAIARTTQAGATKEFTAGLPTGSCPFSIVTGPDGALWFTDQASMGSAIGRIDPITHAIHEFSAGLKPGSDPRAIATGPDGNIWFTDGDTIKAIGRVTTPPAAVTGGASLLGSGAAAVGGTVNGHAQPTSYRFEFGLTGGYGRRTSPVGVGSGFSNVPVSATLRGLSPKRTYHYRLDATNPTGTSLGADATFITPPLPAVRALSVKPKTWRRGSKLARISRKRKRPPVGTKIKFTLNRAAPVRLDFFIRKPGRRVKKKRRLVHAGRLSFTGHSGRNTVLFQGRISKSKRLKPGRYRLKVTATDPTTPTKSSSRSARFRIVRG